MESLDLCLSKDEDGSVYAQEWLAAGFDAWLEPHLSISKLL